MRIQSFNCAPDDRDSSLDCSTSRAGLRTHDLHRLRAWADKLEARFRYRARKICILSEEAVTGMDRFRVCRLRPREDGGYAQITFERRRRANANCFIAKSDVNGSCIGFRINGNW